MQGITCALLGMFGLAIGFACGYLRWRAVVSDLRQVVDVQRWIHTGLAQEVEVLKAAMLEGREDLP